MELLILLVENQGRLVRREAIIQRLWGDNVFVDTRHGINIAVHKLRTALRDDPEHPRIMETVVGKGYRLVADVSPRPTQLDPSLNPAIPPAPSTDTQSKGPQAGEVGVGAKVGSRRGRGALQVGLAIIASLLAALRLVAPSFRSRILGRSRPIESLAVLPFENLSGDSSLDYFADGFTDELTTELAEQTRMRVVSRTSATHYKGSRQALPVIGRELKVGVIVEGSIVLSGQQARVTAQLIQTSNDEHLWAHTYQDRQQDLLSIQNQVAAAIAGFIRVRTESPRSTLYGAISARPRFTPETL